MVEVSITSVRVSLMSEHRLVILREIGADRHLAVWIGQCEAEAIAVRMRDMEVARPLTHDLLKSTITELGGEVVRVVVSELRNDTYHALIVVDQGGRSVEIDSRTSDALALAVRAGVPIYVADDVMEEAGIIPEHDLTGESGEDDPGLSAFRDFVDNLNLDDLPVH